jgi:hypothetical protein
MGAAWEQHDMCELTLNDHPQVCESDINIRVGIVDMFFLYL